MYAHTYLMQQLRMCYNYFLDVDRSALTCILACSHHHSHNTPPDPNMHTHALAPFHTHTLVKFSSDPTPHTIIPQEGHLHQTIPRKSSPPPLTHLTHLVLTHVLATPTPSPHPCVPIPLLNFEVVGPRH